MDLEPPNHKLPWVDELRHSYLILLKSHNKEEAQAHLELNKFLQKCNRLVSGYMNSSPQDLAERKTTRDFLKSLITGVNSVNTLLSKELPKFDEMICPLLAVYASLTIIMPGDVCGAACTLSEFISTLSVHPERGLNGRNRRNKALLKEVLSLMKQFAVKASHSADGPFMNSKQEPGTAVHVDDDTENYQDDREKSESDKGSVKQATEERQGDAESAENNQLDDDQPAVRRMRRFFSLSSEDEEDTEQAGMVQTKFTGSRRKRFFSSPSVGSNSDQSCTTDHFVTPHSSGHSSPVRLFCISARRKGSYWIVTNLSDRRSPRRRIFISSRRRASSRWTVSLL